MQAAIDRVLQTYGLMVNLTAEEEQATRRRLEKHLAGMQADDNALAGMGCLIPWFRLPMDRKVVKYALFAKAPRA